MELQITEIEAPVAPEKRKVSEAKKRATAKWRAAHRDAYREKCRQHSQAYYERHHEEILERARKKTKAPKVDANRIISGSEMSE